MGEFLGNGPARPEREGKREKEGAAREADREREIEEGGRGKRVGQAGKRAGQDTWLVLKMAMANFKRNQN
jgi:hypothetical protein